MTENDFNDVRSCDIRCSTSDINSRQNEVPLYKQTDISIVSVDSSLTDKPREMLGVSKRETI